MTPDLLLAFNTFNFCFFPIVLYLHMFTFSSPIECLYTRLLLRLLSSTVSDAKVNVGPF